jgi:hypothetical protein
MAEIKPGTAPQNASEGGGTSETIFAVIVCALAMFLPVVLIERGYDNFISTHGVVREGAAGASLALAVIVRTVLRNIIRTTARASLRAGVKSAMSGVLRIAIRNLFASFFKTAMGDRLPSGHTANEDAATRRHNNLRSLLVASVLLYASWVIVIGFGQPFSVLMTAQQAAAAEKIETETLKQARANSKQPGIIAWELNQQRDALRESVIAKRKELKSNRDLDEQTRIANELSELNADLTLAQTQLSDALMHSGGLLTRPDDAAKEKERKEVAKLQSWLFTSAPYPGHTPWSSPVIWGAAALFVLPLWFIYLTQSGVARRLGVSLSHETGLPGGLIQLYFAGAFSFMPLASDVIIKGTTAERGRVSLAGILVPTAVSIALWLAWKLTGGTMQPVLLASDAFLLYPMVQCFPLDPLDGSRLFRWHRGLWLVVFVFVMGTFVFMGSEGLKNVI